MHVRWDGTQLYAARMALQYLMKFGGCMAMIIVSVRLVEVRGFAGGNVSGSGVELVSLG